MRTIILKGVEITIGSKVKFIDDFDLYEDIENVNKPELGKVYTVSGYSKKGFYLKEIKNEIIEWNDTNGQNYLYEPGFGSWRFEPYQQLQKKVEINCSFEKIVEEKIDVVIHNPSKNKQTK